MPNQLGKRFVCETCNTEVLCIKAGDGAVAQRGSFVQARIIPLRRLGPPDIWHPTLTT